MKLVVSARKFVLGIFIVFISTILSAKTLAQNNGWIKTSMSEPYIQTLETIPQGVLAGELDTRLWLNPYNGVYVSRDFGETWETFGLQGLGVNDIHYRDKKVYAATYYKDGGIAGLFVLENNEEGSENEWLKIGPNYSANTISSDTQTIYLGTTSYGIWISQDSGQTWTRQTDIPISKVSIIESTNDVTFVAGNLKTYKTENHGETWEPVSGLGGKNISYVAVAKYPTKDVIIVGTFSEDGLYKSIDEGQTWKHLKSFGTTRVMSLLYYNNIFYAGKKDPITNQVSIYKSTDQGESWTNTELNQHFYKNVTGVTSAYSEPRKLFVSLAGDGVYRFEIPSQDPPTFPFLEIPWETQQASDLTDKITAFFDHSYPLLDYSYYSEPWGEAATAVNFLGYRGPTPSVHYSSHNGTDFALLYGTPVTAAASGYATYYTCGMCGAGIKIDHQNGYETLYMHLQRYSVINETSEPVWVDAETVVGKVGLTGNSSGPHLHFGVIKNDKFPDGLVDPYGWAPAETTINTTPQDPWPDFAWTDAAGAHQGAISVNLWKDEIPQTHKVVTLQKETISLENKTITIESASPGGEQATDSTFTLSLKPYITPLAPNLEGLSYIPHTSFLLDAKNHLGQTIETLERVATITIQIATADMLDLLYSTIRLYYWNTQDELWEPLSTQMELVDGTLTAQTSHFSHFAVFGQKTNTTQNPQDKFTDKAKVNGTYFGINF
jgi:murein DD-endopeptidase MepM/ murein hydrolase activator NlpD